MSLCGTGIWQWQEVVCVGVCQQLVGPSEQNETLVLGSAKFKRRQYTGIQKEIGFKKQNLDSVTEPECKQV